MVAVAVYRPVSDHDIRLLSLQHFTHLLVTFFVDFSAAVNLTQEQRSGSGNLTCSLCLSLTYSGCFRMALAFYAGLSSCKIYAHNFMSGICKKTHSASCCSLGIIRMTSDDQNLLTILRSDICFVALS